MKKKGRALIAHIYGYLQHPLLWSVPENHVLWNDDGIWKKWPELWSSFPRESSSVAGICSIILFRDHNADLPFYSPWQCFLLLFTTRGFLMLLQSTDYRQHGGYWSNDLICPYSLRWDSSSYGSLHLPSLDFIYNNNFALKKRSDFVIIHKKESGASWWIQEICRFS